MSKYPFIITFLVFSFSHALCASYFLPPSEDKTIKELRLEIFLAATKGDLRRLEGALKRTAIDLNFHWEANGATPLIGAICVGHVGSIRALLEAKADPNIKSLKSPATPLQIASTQSNGKPEIITLLLKMGARVNELDSHGDTALAYATTSQNLPVMRLLLAANVDVNIRNEEGYGCLDKAVDEGRDDLVRLLLEFGAKTEAPEGVWSPLARHLSRPITNKKILPLLLHYGAQIDEKNPYEVTPFMGACARQDFTIMALALEAGADVNAASNEGNSPLHLAVKDSSLKLINFLLVNKANVNVQNKKGETPLLWAVDDKNVAVVELLLKRNAHPAISTIIRLSPLHIAASLNSSQIVNLLLNYQAPHSPENIFGVTPLSMAAQRGSVEAVKILLAHGADPLNKCAVGFTAIMYAEAHDHKEIVEALEAQKPKEFDDWWHYEKDYQNSDEQWALPVKALVLSELPAFFFEVDSDEDEI